MALRPEDGYIVDSLGWVYFKLGDNEQALATLKKAEKLVPDEPTIQYHLGEVTYAMGERKKALKYFQHALEAWQGKPEADANEVQRIEARIQELSPGH